MPHDIGNASVDTLAEAKAGDTIWYYESQTSLYDESRNYLGRGVWKLYKIEAETRTSLVVHRTKFDRKTGRARLRNGWASSDLIGGNIEREDRDWAERHRYKFLRYLDGLDARKIRMAAEMIGWEPE